MENKETQEGTSLREEFREDAGRVTSATADRLQSEADSRKGQVAEQARATSSALGNAAEGLGSDTPSWIKSALEQGAKSIEQAAQAIEGKDSRQLVGAVQDFARQRPGSFLAGCALLGFAASRVLKAGETHTPTPPAATHPSPFPPHSNSETTESSGPARSMMSFTDGGGAATPVSAQKVGTSL